MLIDEILRCQDGDHQSMLDMIEKFNPILKKYARKLGTEDAYQDLLLEFLETLLRLDCGRLEGRGDGAVVNYISKSVYHAYIKLLHQLLETKYVVLPLDELSDWAMYHNQQFQPLEEVPFDWWEARLSRKERQVFFCVYAMGYSAAEIARFLGTSRQNINKIKTQAIQKLRTYLWNDENF